MKNEKLPWNILKTAVLEHFPDLLSTCTQRSFLHGTVNLFKPYLLLVIALFTIRIRFF
jgi:hypothetical protein